MERKRPSWEEYFMSQAIAAAKRSSCLVRQTGAVVVLGKEIVATGYNGAFRGFQSCYEKGLCRKTEFGLTDKDKNSGKCPAVHAEINAIQRALKHLGRDLGGCVLYTVLFPCDMCAKEIAGAGVSEVVYLLDYHEPSSQTKIFFNERNPPVKLTQMQSFELIEEYKGFGLKPGIPDWH